MIVRGNLMHGVLLVSATLVGAQRVGADESKPLTPGERYQSVLKAQQKALADFNTAHNAASTAEDRKKVLEELGRKSSPQSFAPQFFAIAREFPNDPAALDACGWILTRAANTPEGEAAMSLLIEHWVMDERLVGICKSLLRYPGVGDRLLRAAVETSPHRAVRGYALYSLATSLRVQADRRAAGGRSGTGSTAPEAERLLQQVVNEYADLKHLTTLGKAAEADLFEMRNLAIGKPVPEIAGEDLDGKPLGLTDYRGKIVLIVFWGTWCGPCMSELPHEQELAKKYETKPFAVVGVNSDKDKGAATTACREKGISWPSFWDSGETDGPIAGKWNVHSWPTLYLIDPKGVIRYKGSYLRSISFRDGPDGKPVQFNYLDEAVETLLTEVAKANGS